MAALRSFASGVCTEILDASRGGTRKTSKALFQKVTSASEVLADFLTCAGGVFAVASLYPSLHMSRQTQYSVSIVAGLMIVLMLERDGAYRGGDSLFQIRMTERALRIPGQVLLLLLLCSFLLHLSVPHGAFLVALILLPMLLMFEKQMIFATMRILYAREFGVDRVVVYGAGDAARRMVSSLLYSPRSGLRPVAVIDDDPARSSERLFEIGYGRPLSIKLQSGPVTAALLKSYRCKLLVVAVSSLSPEKLTAAARAAKQVGSDVMLLIDSALEDWLGRESIGIGGPPFASRVDPSLPLHYAVAKRILDLIVASLLLLLLAPLFFLIAVLVWLDSPGPIFFVQKRVGRDGAFFHMYKFRSMHTGAPRYDCSPTQSCDTRITPIGRFLRRTSLDELPQLFNVVRGDMSLVGPRPEMPFIVHRYNSWQQQRLQVIPGITGLWQLSADRAFPIHENIQHDLSYIQNRTFFIDIAILVHTPLRALRGGI
jgi:exopolysaccharide biosynthesis polyprenyl glycosylphosphotransferase